MSIISDPSGSVYAPKQVGGAFPTNKFRAVDANQVRTDLLELGTYLSAGLLTASSVVNSVSPVVISGTSDGTKAVDIQGGHLRVANDQGGESRIYSSGEGLFYSGSYGVSFYPQRIETEMWIDASGDRSSLVLRSAQSEDPSIRSTGGQERMRIEAAGGLDVTGSVTVTEALTASDVRVLQPGAVQLGNYHKLYEQSSIVHLSATDGYTNFRMDGLGDSEATFQVDDGVQALTLQRGNLSSLQLQANYQVYGGHISVGGTGPQSLAIKALGGIYISGATSISGDLTASGIVHSPLRVEGRSEYYLDSMNPTTITAPIVVRAFGVSASAIVVSDGGTIATSQDTGQTWTTSTISQTYFDWDSDNKFVHISGNFVVVVGNDVYDSYNGISWISNDLGQSWTKVAMTSTLTGEWYPNSIFQFQGLVLVGGRLGPDFSSSFFPIMSSNDNGATWSENLVPLWTEFTGSSVFGFSALGINVYVGVMFQDEANAFRQSRTYFSYDGLSWIYEGNRQSPDDQARYRYQAFVKSGSYSYVASYDGINAINYLPLSSGSQFQGGVLDLMYSGSQWVMLTPNSGVFCSRDGGLSWFSMSRASSPYPGFLISDNNQFFAATLAGSTITKFTLDPAPNHMELDANGVSGTAPFSFEVPLSAAAGLTASVITGPNNTLYLQAGNISLEGNTAVTGAFRADLVDASRAIVKEVATMKNVAGSPSFSRLRGLDIETQRASSLAGLKIERRQGDAPGQHTVAFDFYNTNSWFVPLAVRSDNSVLVVSRCYSSFSGTSALSPDGGITWDPPQNIPSFDQFFGMVASGSTFVMECSRDTETLLMTTTDGRTWSSSSVYVPAYLVSSNDRFTMNASGTMCHTFYGYNDVAASSDGGLTWVTASITAPGIAGISTFNGQFIMPSWDGSVRTWLSADGLSWTSGTAISGVTHLPLAPPVEISGSAYMIVRVGDVRELHMSTNGLDWTHVTGCQAIIDGFGAEIGTFSSFGLPAVTDGWTIAVLEWDGVWRTGSTNNQYYWDSYPFNNIVLPTKNGPLMISALSDERLISYKSLDGKSWNYASLDTLRVVSREYGKISTDPNGVAAYISHDYNYYGYMAYSVSDDGVDWDMRRTNEILAPWGDVGDPEPYMAFSEGVVSGSTIVAIGSDWDGGANCAASYDAGLTWQFAKIGSIDDPFYVQDDGRPFPTLVKFKDGYLAIDYSGRSAFSRNGLDWEYGRYAAVNEVTSYWSPILLDRGEYVLLASSEHLARSYDGLTWSTGSSWNMPWYGGEVLSMVSLQNGDICLIDDTGLPWLSRDGGGTWVQGTPFLTGLSSANVIQLSDQTVIAGLTHQSDQNMWIASSSDGGLSWGEIDTGLSGPRGGGTDHTMPFAELSGVLYTVANTNWWYGDRGNIAFVLSSSDSGATWGSSSFMSGVNIGDGDLGWNSRPPYLADIAEHRGRLLLVGTWGNFWGMIFATSGDGGATWSTGSDTWTVDISTDSDPLSMSVSAVNVVTPNSMSALIGETGWDDGLAIIADPSSSRDYYGVYVGVSGGDWQPPYCEMYINRNNNQPYIDMEGDGYGFHVGRDNGNRNTVLVTREDGIAGVRVRGDILGNPNYGATMEANGPDLVETILKTSNYGTYTIVHDSGSIEMSVRAPDEHHFHIRNTMPSGTIFDRPSQPHNVTISGSLNVTGALTASAIANPSGDLLLLPSGAVNISIETSGSVPPSASLVISTGSFPWTMRMESRHGDLEIGTASGTSDVVKIDSRAINFFTQGVERMDIDQNGEIEIKSGSTFVMRDGAWMNGDYNAGGSVISIRPDLSNPGGRTEFSGNYANVKITADNNNQVAGIEIYAVEPGNPAGIHISTEDFARWTTLFPGNIYAGTESGSFSIDAIDREPIIYASPRLHVGAALNMLDQAEGSGSTQILQMTGSASNWVMAYPALVITPSSTLGYGERVIVSGAKADVHLTTDGDNSLAGVEIFQKGTDTPGISIWGMSGTAAQMYVVDAGADDRMSQLTLNGHTSGSINRQLIVSCNGDDSYITALSNLTIMGGTTSGSINIDNDATTDVNINVKLWNTGKFTVQDGDSEFSGSVNISGALTASSIHMNGDVVVTGSANGLVLQSPDGTRWRLTIDNSGTLAATSL